MFEKTTLHHAIFQKLKANRIEILALVIFLAGSGVSGFGLAALGETGAAGYELQPVLAECPRVVDTGSLKVDAGGAIKNPGLYTVEEGARIGDVIKAAGGLHPDADGGYISSQLNAAKPVKDGDKIYIPYFQEEQALAAGGSALGSEQPPGNSNLISINQATEKQLLELPQIGEKRAADIVAGRPYQSIEELVELGVLTQGIFSGIEELISL